MRPKPAPGLAIRRVARHSRAVMPVGMAYLHFTKESNATKPDLICAQHRRPRRH
jgi:hypothetical protein